MGKISGKVRLGIALTLIMGLASCATQFRNHGYVPAPDELANIIVGKDTRETVSSIIGRPTASGILDASAWYYVESRFRHVGFLAPKEIEREVVTITFDGRDRVANIERFGLEDGQVISLSRRVTETSVVKISLLRQLLGNVGRIGQAFN